MAKIVEIYLGEAEVGEMVQWTHRSNFFGETYGDVVEKGIKSPWGLKVLCKADNGVSYEWPADMRVLVVR